MPRWPGRHRGATAVAIGLVVLAGLGSRSEAVGLQWAVAKYTGDGLWGLVVYLGIGLLLSRLPPRRVVGLAVAFACAVEFGQLVHVPWLDAIRAVWLGGMILGTPAATFAWTDLAAYLAGIAAGALFERFLYSTGA